MDISNWKFEDIEQYLLSNNQESLYQDFKESRALLNWNDEHKKELAKDVSSFANTGGGLLIYGAKEKDYKFERFDDGLPVKDAWHERVQQVLDSPAYLHRKIEGLVIHKVDNPVKQEMVFLLIYIPKSFYPIMHNKTHMFWKRTNNGILPMEGFEVEDVWNRRQYPSLELLTPLWKKTISGGDAREYTMDVVLRNDGLIRIHDWKVVCYFPYGYLFPLGLKKKRMEAEGRFGLDYEKKEANGLKFHVLQTLGESVLFPEEEVITLQIKYYLNDERFDKIGGKFFEIIVYADDITPIKKQFLLKDFQDW